MIDTIQDMVGRQQTAAAARPSTFVHRRLRESAQASSRKLLLQSQADLMTAALRTFITLCYDHVDGVLCNVDGSGGILVPSPWSRSQHGLYGLTDGTHRMLRRIIVKRAQGHPSRDLLLIYSTEYRRWFLNLTHYRTLTDALQWLDNAPITAGEILTAGGL